MPTVKNIDQITYNGVVYKLVDSTSGYITSTDVPEGSTASGVTPANVTSGTASKGTDNGFARGDHVHHIDIKQDGISGTTINRYGSCSIAAGTAAKTVSITTGTFVLLAGARVAVKFTNANTASNPTLNVNSTGAKNIFHKGERITTGDNKGLLAGLVEFIYDGTQYHIIGSSDLLTSSAITTALGFTPYNSTNPSGYTTNTGTVTKVTVGSDLKVGSTAGGNFTTTGTISHTNSVTAGTAGTSSATSGSTLAVPYITYDANGHITGTGTHTHTITGFATTDNDTKVSTAAITSGTLYYPTIGTDTTSAATKYYDKTGYTYKGTNGTTSAVGTSVLTLGNSTASGTANNKKGQLALYGSTAYLTTIDPGAPTAARTLTLPNASGTVALTSNIPTVPTNVSAFTNDAGYTTNIGTVTGVKINGQTMNPTNGIVDLGNIQTSSGSLNISYNADDAATDGAGIAEVTFSGSGGSVNPATYQTDFKHATISSGDSNYTNVLSFTLSAGIWIVHAFLRIAGDSTTGVRSMCVSETSGGNYSPHATNVDVTTTTGLANKNNASSTVITAAPGGKYAHLHITKIYNLTEEKTYYINGYHTAGSNKNCVAGYTAIKLG